MHTNLQLLRQIITPLLPVEPPLAEIERKEVTETVVDFVAAQIEGMPTYLRWPYLLVMFAFNWMSLRQYAHRFTTLESVKQRDYVNMWIHSSVSAKKDFIKLIRSCALLQFYDHPVVRGKLEENE